MKRTHILYLTIVVMFIIIVSLVISLNPLRKSEERIKNWLLEIIPLGTDIDDAIEIIENKKWEITWISENGYSIDKNGRPGEGYKTIVGNSSIRANIGDYRNIFITDVITYFGFDEKKTLVEISVRKDTDGF